LQRPCCIDENITTLTKPEVGCLQLILITWLFCWWKWCFLCWNRSL